MKISICIPQYGRSKFLLEVLESIRAQTYANIEVVISDDCSRDDTSTVIPEYLERSGMTYKFVQQPSNVGYDANLRAALSLGTGDYLFVLGNDDALAYAEALAELARAIEANDRPAIVLVNHRDWSDVTGAHPTMRAQTTRLLHGGTHAAAQVYRAFSFVGGIIYRRDAFEAHNTSAFDGSVFVQVYLSTRIIAAGGSLLFLEAVMVAKDVMVDGRATDTYKDVHRRGGTPVLPNSQGVGAIAWVASEAILPLVAPTEREAVLMSIYRPLMMYTYSYWLYAHKRDRFWAAAASMVWGCYPPILLAPVGGSLRLALRLMPYYVAATMAACLTPTAALERMKGWGQRRSKRVTIE